MTDPSPARSRNPVTARALDLDALAAILPMDRRDRLAEILTDDDVATLKHLAKEGMGENSLRALASDLAYLEAWALASTGSPLPWPAPEALALKFVAHHLWDPARREAEPNHGMPAELRSSLRARDLLAGRRAACACDSAAAPAELVDPASLERRAGPVHIAGAAFGDPALGARDGAAAPAEEPAAVTRDVLEALLATCGSDRLADARDAALLLVAFASGGRRRSEVASLRAQQQTDHHAERRGVREVVHRPTEPKPPENAADHLAQQAVALAHRAFGRLARMGLRRALTVERVEPVLEAFERLLALSVGLRHERKRLSSVARRALEAGVHATARPGRRGTCRRPGGGHRFVIDCYLVVLAEETVAEQSS